jgi:hypothetical protein
VGFIWYTPGFEHFCLEDLAVSGTENKKLVDWLIRSEEHTLINQSKSFLFSVPDTAKSSKQKCSKPGVYQIKPTIVL